MEINDEKYLKFQILGKTYELPYVSGNKTKERLLMISTIMFAEKGYDAVTIREIGEAIGIKGASIYNHFKSKDELWNAVLDHAMLLYDLYIKQLGVTLEEAGSFKEVLEIFYTEPKKLVNLFTCFAFSLLFTDQFKDARAGELFGGTFLGYGVEFHKKWLDRCVEKGYVKAFDTRAVALVLINSVTVGLCMKVQQILGREVPIEPELMFVEQQKLLLDILNPSDEEDIMKDIVSTL